MRGRTRPAGWLVVFAALLGIALGGGALPGNTFAPEGLAGQTISVTPQEARAIAKEAYIYGAPMVQGYGAMFAHAVYKDNPQYKAPFNQIANEGRVFTPEDTATLTANRDTPYSFLWADLRAEPLVLHTAAMEKNRYWSIQFVDLYTWNFAYAGTRTTGNEEQQILLAGPNWKGEVPKSITQIIRSETDFVLATYRTQLFDAADIDNVLKIQAGYTVKTLSKFVRKAAPRAAPTVDFPPYVPQMTKSLEFFNYLNFLLQFCPTVAEDREARERFARIGVEPGTQFNPDTLSPDMQKALEAGMSDGQKAIQQNATAMKSSAELYGTREFMKNNYLNRATGAEAGMYGNSEEEAFHYAFYKDQKETILDASKGNYTMHFDKGKLPPVRAFWSLTLYDAKTKLPIANPMDRYLINSPMLPGMKLDAAGGLTIYIQPDSPGKDKEANWLPAPERPFFLEMRCYWPEKAIIEGSWQPPIVMKGR